MLTNYAACLAFVLDPNQDGQPAHLTPGDRGGWTALGVTHITLSAWLGRMATIEDLKALTKDEAGAIYEANYWHPINGDHLPPGVDLMAFDLGVTSGPHNAVTQLQQVLGFTGVDVDGVTGPRTLTAARGEDLHSLVGRIANRQELFYRSLADFSRFGRGWLARLNRRTTAALNLLPGGLVS
jgi:lysozyme family protein